MIVTPSASLGLHVIADFHGATQLIDPAPAASALRRAARAAGATVLRVDLHDFGDRAGFTGAALLAESHITVHTWPEHELAALDLFLCGACAPDLALDILRAHFRPAREHVSRIARGALSVPVE